jgi:hypothetical protein
MFFSPWYVAFGNGKMDGCLDFQADGAAQYQARSQATADDRRSRSIDIDDSLITIGGGGQVILHMKMT